MENKFLKDRKIKEIDKRRERKNCPFTNTAKGNF